MIDQNDFSIHIIYLSHLTEIIIKDYNCIAGFTNIFFENFCFICSLK
jgi:hypothetical protein